MHISTWLTLVYAAVLVFVLVFTSIVSAIGIYYSLYHQAETDLMRSQEHVLAAIDRGTEIFNETGPDMRRRYPLVFAIYEEDLLMPGVVLRVTEGADGPVVYESDTHYPSISLVEGHIDKHPPLWANSSMYVSTIGNTHIYYHKVIVNQKGRTYVLHFFRTITAERHFLATLQKVLTITNFVGVLLALAAGYFISCRILRPIRTMTQAARARCSSPSPTTASASRRSIRKRSSSASTASTRRARAARKRRAARGWDFRSRAGSPSGTASASSW